MRMHPVFYCVEDQLSRSIMDRLLQEYCGGSFIFQELLKTSSAGIGKMRFTASSPRLSAHALGARG